MILLVDTFSALFRAHYALPPMSTRAGEPTAALYGFSSLVLKLLREYPGAALSFALDGPTPTFRDEVFGEYKAGRARLPDALHAQLARLPRLLSAFGVPVLAAPGFEADDVLATLARRAEALGEPALIVSGDRDFFQLARPGVEIYFIGARGQPALIYDVERVTARFGVPPQRLPAYVALVGDASDNLPSVPGIGPRTARALLTGHPSAGALLDALEGVASVRVRERLAAHREQILLTERLARLRDDVPLEAPDPPWSKLSPGARGELRRELEVLEFKSLLQRLDRLE